MVKVFGCEMMDSVGKREEIGDVRHVYLGPHHE